MQMTETQKPRRQMSDRTLNRLIIGLIVALVIAVPLIGVIYFVDRSTDAGPSMAGRAVSAAEAAVRANPNNVAARMALASSYMADHRTADAVAQYQQILAVTPDHHGALLGIGNAYLVLKDDADAQKAFQHLVDVAKGGESALADPQLEEAYFRLGQIAYAAGRYPEAESQAQAALAISRTDADAMNLLAAAMIKNGKASGAIPILKAAVAFVPTGWCDPYQHLAEAYGATASADGVAYANAMVAFCSGQLDVAKQALSGIASGQFSLDATLGLGMIAEQAGDKATATAMYEKVLAMDPQNANATFGLQRLGTDSSADPHGGAQAPVQTPAASPTTGANP
jgi:tetratricopeptide (TPR) repeat protein